MPMGNLEFNLTLQVLKPCMYSGLPIAMLNIFAKITQNRVAQFVTVKKSRHVKTVLHLPKLLCQRWPVAICNDHQVFYTCIHVSIPIFSLFVYSIMLIPIVLKTKCINFQFSLQNGFCRTNCFTHVPPVLGSKFSSGRSRFTGREAQMACCRSNKGEFTGNHGTSFVFYVHLDIYIQYLYIYISLHNLIYI